MCPLVKFGMIEKAINYFLCDAFNVDQEIVNQCLELVQFGMLRTFITFEDTYWFYGGNVPVKLKGPSIGGFLVATYIIKNNLQ